MIKLLQAAIRAQKEKVGVYEKHIISNSPERNLKLGYSIAFDQSGRVVKSIKNVKVGQNLQVNVSDGRIRSKINKLIEKK